MTELFVEDHRAFQLGWVLIKSIPIKGDGVQAPGAVTMCEIDNPHHPFAVHFFNAQDGGFHAGEYSKTRAEAEEKYAIKAMLRLSFEQVPFDTTNVCLRCDIVMRPEGGHVCGTCGKDI
jgi:hypothetical protein